MNYDKNLLIHLSKNGCTQNDYLIIECIIENKADVLMSFLENKTEKQKIAFMQGTIRRGFIFKPLLLFKKLDFSINDYKLTSKAITLYNELVNIYKESLNNRLEDNNEKNILNENNSKNENINKEGSMNFINNPVLFNTEKNKNRLSILKKELILNEKDMPKKEYADQERLNSLVGKFMDLFPKGVTNKHGSYIRGSKASVKLKMNNFLLRNPDYTDEQILLATEQFLKKQGNPKAGLPYEYCPQSHFFIEKEGISQLENHIENYSEEDMNKNSNSIDSMFNDIEY